MVRYFAAKCEQQSCRLAGPPRPALPWSAPRQPAEEIPIKYLRCDMWCSVGGGGRAGMSY